MDLMSRLTRYRLAHARRPTGRFGRLLISAMNLSHVQLTNWGLSHLTVGEQFTVLDVGCGGGGALRKLAKRTVQGKVLGIDPSGASVAVARSALENETRSGRVFLVQGEVSALPYADDTADLVTGVNTHLYWPNLPGDLREIRRVLKPEGALAIVSSVREGGKHAERNRKYAEILGIAFPDVEELVKQFVAAGFSVVETHVEARKDWICVTGQKPQATGTSR